MMLVPILLQLTFLSSTGAIAISLAYGLKFRDVNDPFIGLAQRAIKSLLDAAIPGAFLVDLIPWLKYVPEWMPGAGFQKQANEWKRLQKDFHNIPYDEALKNLVLPLRPSSFGKPV